VDFRSHVVVSAQDSPESASTVLSSHSRRKPEVGKEQIVLLVEEQVFRLEVSVSESLRVAVIEGLNQLLEVVSGLLLCETSSVAQEVENFTSVGKLQNCI